MNRFDPKQIAHSVTGDKPPFIKIVFPAPAVEVAGGGPVGGQTVEDYVRLRSLPKDMQDRIVLYIKETLRA